MEQEGSQLWSGASLAEAMWRSRWMILAAVLVTAVAGYGLSLLQSKEYQGEASLILSDPRNAGVFQETTLVVNPTRYLRNQAERIMSTEVLSIAAELEGEGMSVEDIRSRVKTSAATELDLITIKATDSTPEGAASLANSVGEAYERAVAEDVANSAEDSLIELERARIALEDRIDELDAQLAADPDAGVARAERSAAITQLATLRTRSEQIAVDAALYGSGVEVFERSVVPSSPSSPRPLRNAALAAVLGLLGAGALAWWRFEHAQSAERRHDAARVLRAPLLGQIPVYEPENGPSVAPAGSAPAEAYQFVLNSLEFALNGESSIVVVTSADQGDGKTSTAMNVAAAAAQAGRSVLLIDGDERVRGLTRQAAMDPQPGLTDLVLGTVTLEECALELELPDGVSIQFVPGGRRLKDPRGFFANVGFRRLMADIRESVDLVLIDTPPILAVADAAAMAAQADGIMVVVNKGTPLKRLEEVRDRLDFVGTPVLGYLFNRSNPDMGRYRYGYGTFRKQGQPYGYRLEPNGEREPSDHEPEQARPAKQRERGMAEPDNVHQSGQRPADR